MSVRFEEKEKRKKEPIVVKPESFGERESVFEWEEGASGVVVSPYGEVRFERPKGRKTEKEMDWNWERMFGLAGGAVWGPSKRWIELPMGPPLWKKEEKREEERGHAPQPQPEPQPVKPPEEVKPQPQPTPQPQPQPQPSPTQQPAQTQTTTPALVKRVRLLDPPEGVLAEQWGTKDGVFVNVPFKVEVELDKPATGNETIGVEVFYHYGQVYYPKTVRVNPQAGATKVTATGTVRLHLGEPSEPVPFIVKARALTLSPIAQNEVWSGETLVEVIPGTAPQSTPQPSQSQKVTAALVKRVRLVDPPEGVYVERKVNPNDNDIYLPFKVEVELDRPATGNETINVGVIYAYGTYYYPEVVKVTPKAGDTKVTATGTVRVPIFGWYLPYTYDVKAVANTVAPIVQNGVWSGEAHVTFKS